MVQRGNSLPKVALGGMGLPKDALAWRRKILLQVINKHQILNFAELEATFLKVSKILNQRPLTARHYSEDNYVPISPYDLLLGRASGLEDRVVTVWQGLGEDEHNLTSKQENIRLIVEAWWQQWQQEAFPLFCPRKK